MNFKKAYKKALEFDAAIKNEAQKLRNKPYIASIACELSIRKNDVERSISYLPHLKNDTLLSKCSYALMLAKIYIMQNETEKAKEQLSFVIKNASKISLGQEASELLKNIS